MGNDKTGFHYENVIYARWSLSKLGRWNNPRLLGVSDRTLSTLRAVLESLNEKEKFYFEF